MADEVVETEEVVEEVVEEETPAEGEEELSDIDYLKAEYEKLYARFEEKDKEVEALRKETGLTEENQKRNADLRKFIEGFTGRSGVTPDGSKAEPPAPSTPPGYESYTGISPEDLTI